VSLSSTNPRFLPPAKALYKKIVNFFRPLPGDVPCWGLSLGRQALWAARRLEMESAAHVDECFQIPLDAPLFAGAPSPETGSALTQALKVLAEKKKGSFQTLQVALPDPMARFEVFEVEKVPAPGNPLQEFLAWRFHQGGEDEKLVFAHQILGKEEGKNLLLGLAFEQRWMSLLKECLSGAGLRPSRIDTALNYRFNFYHDLFARETGGGALVTLEPDYWSLGIWDEGLRLRYVRAKWWDKEVKKIGDLPLQKVALEVERTLRSYVYSAPGRSVQTVFLLAPPLRSDPLWKIFRRGTGENCEVLDLKGLTPGRTAVPPGLSPTALAAAVKR